jgi:hypothetical protein
MRNFFASPNALGHIVAGEFNVNSSRMRSKFLMNFKESLYFIQNIIKLSSLVSAWRLIRIAMHGITNPEHFCARFRYGVNKLWQDAANIACSHAGNKCETAWLIIGIKFLN